ncbi:MAG: hypothetical protein ACWGNK_07320, partial [Desulfobacterales bacterium]
MIFEFGTANRIIFGSGAVARVGRLAAALGRRVLVVTGSSPERGEALLRQLKDQGLVTDRITVAG